MIQFSATDLHNREITAGEFENALRAMFGEDFRGSVVVVDDPEGEYDFGDLDFVAPELVASVLDFATMVAQLAAMLSSVQGVQMDLNATRLQTITDQRKALNDQMIEKLQLAIKCMLEAQQAQTKNNTIGMVRAVFEVIGSAIAVLGAILLTPLTGPAAIVCATGAILGMGLALLDLANACYAKNGVSVEQADGSMRPKDVSLCGMVSAITDRMIEDGLLAHLDTPEKVNDWKMAWGIATNMLVMTAMVGCGGFGAVKVNGIAKAAREGCEDALKKLERASVNTDCAMRLGDLTAQLGHAATGVTQGVLTRMSAGIKLTADEAAAAKEFLSALVSLFGTQAQQIIEVITGLTEGFWQTMQSHNTMTHLFCSVPNPALNVN